MTKQVTITLDEQVYHGLQELVGDDQISEFIENLVRPRVLKADLEEGYRLMAEDTQRETDALEWSENLIGDPSHEAR